MPLRNLTHDGQAVAFDLPAVKAHYAGTLSADGGKLAGTWTQPGFSAPVEFVRGDGAEPQAAARPQTPKPPFPYQAEEVAFANPVQTRVHLAGTLTLPAGKGPFPAAVLITGSGAQDRDETLLGHKPFAVIADHLTAAGIAVLRYDDRGVGESTGDHAAANSADFATDANAAAALPAGPAGDPPWRDRLHRPFGRRHDRARWPWRPMTGLAFLMMLAGPGRALGQADAVAAAD